MKKLLLADDSVTIQKVVGLVLADEGFELKLTNNGKEAVEALSSFMPDVVLADVDMPEMNGYELARAIKETPATSFIPVILMVGAFETVDENLIKEAGADDYVIKPFESRDLITKLQAVLPAEKEAVLQEAAPEEEAFAKILSEAAAGQANDLPPAAAQQVAAQVPEEYVEEYVPEVVVPPVEERLEDSIAVRAISLTGLEAARQEVASQETTPETAEAKTNAYPHGGTTSEDSEIVSPEEIKAAVVAKVNSLIEGALGKLDFPLMVSDAALPAISAAAQQIAAEALPRVIEPLVSEAVALAAAAMKEAVERIIRQSVPELAESIIKKEIESIKREI